MKLVALLKDCRVLIKSRELKLWEQGLQAMQEARLVGDCACLIRSADQDDARCSRPRTCEVHRVQVVPNSAPQDPEVVDKRMAKEDANIGAH